ncbi:MAG: uracil-DNA glycosylase [Candidatus Dojkabacteria bacterium]|nr:uracil-DNA glycosylase [Candidatus Dojkabacteria bacterium]
MSIDIHESWENELKEEFEKQYFKELISFVKEEYKTKTIFPPGPQIFNAFNATPFEKVKVVILGQDPYHTPGVANGLAFAAKEGNRVPPSLQNIYKELYLDLGIEISTNPDITRWANQGVLLLNSTLTVQKGTPGSHQKKGWEEFSDSVINVLNDKKENLVFILWGKYAQDKGNSIDRTKHMVIESPHPSPFSANKGFFGSRPFGKTNEYLDSKGIEIIQW